MGEKVARVGVDKESGWLYYVDKDGDVSRSKMARGGRKKGSTKREKVARVGVEKESGYLYYVDKDGDVGRSKMARGR
jgi:hypothetical protein